MGKRQTAYRETDSSLYDPDKNRLFGAEHYKSCRPVYKPSPVIGHIIRRARVQQAHKQVTNTSKVAPKPDSA